MNNEMYLDCAGADRRLVSRRRSASCLEVHNCGRLDVNRLGDGCTKKGNERNIEQMSFL